MTDREKAIKEIEILKEDYWDDDGYGHETNQHDDTMLALDMAINALKHEPCKDISEDGTLTVNVEDGNKVSRVLVCGDNLFGGLYYPEQELCADAISRQAVLEIIEREEFKGDALSEIEKLSSVIPHPKTGKWGICEDADEIHGVYSIPDIKITALMPLPESYKQEVEE